MKYKKIVPGVFLVRPNRFVAYVEIGGKKETCHVKNTGRCRELLPEGARVWCSDEESPKRKTKYDLVAVEKNGRLINMDSQAPNRAVWEWLMYGGMGNLTDIRPETVYGDSRIDFSFKKDGVFCLMEVKGVTLENNGICAFPDAPTQRGTKHLRELAKAAQRGVPCYLMFVIQMADVTHLVPNDATDPAFGKALRDARRAGVHILAYDCDVLPDAMQIRRPVPVKL